MPLEPTFSSRIASEADAPAIAALVNRAYRPEPGKAGWTHESELVAGERINADKVRALFQPESTVLVLSENQTIVACVHVMRTGEQAYIGMLATEPTFQAQGLGKHMLEFAEEYAVTQFGVTEFIISVVSSSPALLAFYQRRGYVLTGQVKPYPSSEGVGQPKRADLHLQVLTKPVPNLVAAQ